MHKWKKKHTNKCQIQVNQSSWEIIHWFCCVVLCCFVLHCVAKAIWSSGLHKSDPRLRECTVHLRKIQDASGTVDRNAFHTCVCCHLRQTLRVASFNSDFLRVFLSISPSPSLSLSFSLSLSLALFLQVRHRLRLAHPQGSAGALGHPRFHHLRRGDPEGVFAVSPADVCAGEFFHLVRSKDPWMASSDWRPLRCIHQQTWIKQILKRAHRQP